MQTGTSVGLASKETRIPAEPRNRDSAHAEFLADEE
jgi:hypothetical protein